MAVTTDSCPVCGFPVAIPTHEGQTSTCAYCLSPMTASFNSDFISNINVPRALVYAAAITAGIFLLKEIAGRIK